jgi:preprotein translocase subunit SecE
MSVLAKRKPVASASKFFKEMRFELRKVAWPSRSELITSTIVVIIAVTIITLFVGGLDFVLARIWRLLTRTF